MGSAPNGSSPGLDLPSVGSSPSSQRTALPKPKAVTGTMTASETRFDFSIRLTSGPRASRSTSSVRAARASSASSKRVSILLSTSATAAGCFSGRNRKASRR